MNTMVNAKQFLQFLSPYCVSFEKSVGVIVFRVVHGKIEFLFLQYRSGHWEFPRGHVEDDETEYDTLQRELKEETGIVQISVVEGFREVMSFSYKAHGQELKNRRKNKSCMFIHKKVIFYLAQTTDVNIVLSDEHQKFKWLTFEKGYQKLTFKNARDILLKAHKKLTNNDNEVRILNV